MKILFRDHNSDVIEALKAQYETGVTKEASFDMEPCVFEADFKVGDVFQDKAHAFVSPANSFGYMDGGIDLHYCKTFGWELQEITMEAIKNQCEFGELLVGQALTIPVPGQTAEFRYMICAPTMRMPERLSPNQGRINAFLATRAAVYNALLDEFVSLIIPGMGTGTGRVHPKEAAQAMIFGANAAFRKIKPV